MALEIEFQSGKETINPDFFFPKTHFIYKAVCIKNV